MNKNNLAFPIFYGPGDTENDTGMTLRDYFAAKAMQGLLASDEYSTESHNHIALLAYEQADAMMVVRS